MSIMELHIIVIFASPTISKKIGNLMLSMSVLRPQSLVSRSTIPDKGILNWCVSKVLWFVRV